MKLEPLKPEEFDAHLLNKTLRLAFVGMSNTGKSYRSRILRDSAGFNWYRVDEAIQEALGFNSMESISEWLGYPLSEGYAERERRYLELENEYTKRASMSSRGRNFVFDTTGSAVHLKPDTLDVLNSNCLVVHLEVEENEFSKMLDEFLKIPKPVAWAGHFLPETGETESETIRRCYPQLLTERLAKYRALAHLNVPAARLRDTSADETLAIIKSHL